MKFLLACAASLALTVPLHAQDTASEAVPAETSEGDAFENVDAIMGNVGGGGETALMLAMMQQMFAAPELTAEQEAVLPLATQVAEKMLPEGIYARAMVEAFSSFLEPIMGLAPKTMPVYDMSERLGVGYEVISALDQNQQDEIGRILDPAFEQRGRAMADFVMAKTTETMALIEPGLRRGMARSYATRFTQQQLGDILAFFSTPSGAAFAGESLLAFSDRQAIAGMMADMPRLIENLPDFEAGVDEAVAALPKERELADLSQGDRKRLSQLVGVTVNDLEKAMAEAAAAREAVPAEAWDPEETEAVAAEDDSDI